MIDDLRAMAIFATVAETGSFSAAGRQLRLATSGISQHVTKLEDRLGVTLFYAIKGAEPNRDRTNLVLSRLRSGLPTHLSGLSLESQGAFSTQR